ncbi:hypothetical protein JYT44_02320 [Caldithrix abyssi]|nr:hypothetical protein [Caldithrix abyssi]
MIKNWLIILAWMGILSAQSNLEKGFAAYNQRTEGSIEDHAQPGPINKAIKYFLLALGDPESEFEAAVGLLKSYYFKGKHVVRTEDEQKAVFNEAKKLALAYIEKNPDRVEFHYWYLANLGSWAEVYGTLAAAKEGVSDQMKEHANIIIIIDPEYKNGGGYFFLGVTHFKSPYIPFILSWPDKKEAVKWLKKANKTGEATPMQKVYLARALYKEKEKGKAITLMKEVAAMTPSSDDSVIDWGQIKEARTFLKKYQ